MNLSLPARSHQDQAGPVTRLRTAKKNVLIFNGEILLHDPHKIRTIGIPLYPRTKNGEILYKKSPFLYVGTYVTLAFIAIAWYIFTHESPVLLRFFIVIIAGLLIYGFGIQQFYFIVANDGLIVRNHWFLWIKRAFPYRSIESLHLEEPRESTSQKGIPLEAGILFFADGKRYTYRSGPLNREDIENLLKDLRSRISIAKQRPGKK